MKESQEIPVIQKRYTCQLNIASARQCYIGSTCRKTYVRFGINHPLLFVKQQQAMVILNTKICHYGLHIQSCWGCYDFKICQHFTYNLIGWKFKSESFLIFESTLTDWFTSGSSNCHHSLTLGSASRRSWWQNHRRLWANKALDIHHGWSSRNRDGWSATLCRLYSTIIYIWTCDHSYDKFLFNGLSFQKLGAGQTWWFDNILLLRVFSQFDVKLVGLLLHSVFFAQKSIDAFGAQPKTPSGWMERLSLRTLSFWGAQPCGL